MYSITGWSRGARVPITHNLRAGQMRGMGRVNMFPTVINNNYFGVDYGNYDTCCNNSNSIPKWTQWLMGIGLGTSFIGNILGIFSKDGGGGEDVEGAGGTEKPQETTTAANKKQDEFEGLKVLYPDGKFAKIADKYRCNIGDQSFEADSLVDLDKQLKKTLKKTSTETPKSNDKTRVQEEPTTSTEELQDGSFTEVIDEVLGEKSKISGTVTVDKKTGDVSIKDKNNTYTYSKGNKTITYKEKQYTVYTLKGATNNVTNKNIRITTQEYISINGKLVQPSDCKELIGGGTGSIKKAPPPEETQVASTNKTHKAPTKNTEKKATNNTNQTDTTPKAETFKANYTVTMNSGNKCYLKIDQNNNYRYFNKEDKEITASEFQKQTGQTAQVTMNKINKQNEVNSWNKQHPQNKVTLKNGKYTTIVKSNLGNTEISANSFDELKNKVYAHLKKANAPANTNKYTTGGYNELGKMMQH